MKAGLPLCVEENSTLETQTNVGHTMLRPASGQILDSDKRKSKGSNDSTATRLNDELEKVKEMARDKQQKEKLLSRILPTEVSKQLASGSTVEPKPYENVTVYF